MVSCRLLSRVLERASSCSVVHSDAVMEDLGEASCRGEAAEEVALLRGVDGVEETVSGAGTESRERL